MADTMQGLKRTHYCGEVTEAAIGSEVVVSGWVQRARNLGNLIFIDLRDRSRCGSAGLRRQDRPCHL